MQNNLRCRFVSLQDFFSRMNSVSELRLDIASVLCSRAFITVECFVDVVIVNIK